MRNLIVILLLAAFCLADTLAYAADKAGSDVSQRAQEILSGKNGAFTSRTNPIQKVGAGFSSLPWYKKTWCVLATLLVAIVAGVLGWIIFPLTLAPINLIVRSELSIIVQRIAGAIGAAGACGYYTMIFMVAVSMSSLSGEAGKKPDRAQAFIQAAMEEEAALKSK